MDQTNIETHNAKNAETDTQSVPENPTREELKTSLKKANFPAAERMAEQVFGVSDK